MKKTKLITLLSLLFFSLKLYSQCLYYDGQSNQPGSRFLNG